MGLTADELVEVEAIEQLEAASMRTRISQPHAPEIELIDERSARGRWSLLEYQASREPAREQSYSTVVAEYYKADGGWCVGLREVTRLRTDVESWPLPAPMPPTAPSERWLSDATPPGPDQLADVEAIKQLKARYFRYMDTKDWPRWREQFSDTATFEVAPAVPPNVDADGFVETVARNLTGTLTVHHGHAPQIAFTSPDTAVGIWALNDYVEREAGATSSSLAGLGNGMRGYGHYEERYTRENGSWKIAHLRLSYLRVDPLVREPIRQDGGRSPVSVDWLAGGCLPTAQQLASLHEIRQLSYRHCRLQDSKLWDELPSLFTPDAMVLEGPGARRTVTDYVKASQKTLSAAATIHHIHMPEIRFTGDGQARGIWATFRVDDGPGDMGSVRYGHLEAGYRQESGTWLIESLRVRPLRVDPLTVGRPLEPMSV